MTLTDPAVSAFTAPAAPAHPLGSLTPAEITAVRAIVAGLDGVDEATRFAYVGLEEAPKGEILAWERGEAEAQAIARGMLAGYGWGDDQFGCLVALWDRESGWNSQAYNASSGAYGIPQALPGSKMASAGADWQTNAATQISWGLGYIAGRYGNPCGAWSHSESVGWY